MNSLPFVPRQTVIFLPRRMKVKTSPYYNRVSLQVDISCKVVHLFTAGEEKLEGINAISNSTAEEWYQMEDDWWFVRILKEQLIEDVYQDGEGCEDGQCEEDELPKRKHLDEALDRRQQCTQKSHGGSDGDHGRRGG